MNCRRIQLGETGLTVQRLGFGGIPIQRVEASEAEATVKRALELGIDFFDTARAYRTSEMLIGRAVQRLGCRKRVVLASKSMARSAETMLADVRKSLKDLVTGRIDLYQCHMVKSLEEYGKVVESGGALEGLLQARSQGLIDHVGLSSHRFDVLKKVIADGFFEVIMVCFGFLEPEAREEIIPAALERKMGFVAMKTFGGGMIEDPGPALRWALSHQGVVILAGMERPEWVEENWNVFQDGGTLSEADARRIEEIRGESGKAYCRRCDYCQPCTEGIPIQTVLSLTTMVKRMGPEILKDARRTEALEKARLCSECGECMTRCPYELSIPDLVRERVDWAERLLAGL